MPETNTLRSASSDISAYIAVLLTKNSFDPNFVAKAEDVLRGWSISVSEDGEYLLKETLNLAAPVADGSYALTKSSDAFADHFSSGEYDDCFDAILRAYLGFVEWNGEVPTVRAWFAPPKKHLHILKHLADMGYLEASADDMRWTDLAGPAMLCAGAWTTELQSHQEVADWHREKEARQIASSLPSDLVFLAMNDPGAAYWRLHRRLEGIAWFDIPDKRLIERVIEILQSKKSD